MSPKTLAGYATTILMIAGAVYIFTKHKNEQGFWWGVLALLLLGSFIEFRTPMLSAKVGAPTSETV